MVGEADFVAALAKVEAAVAAKEAPPPRARPWSAAVAPMDGSVEGVLKEGGNGKEGYRVVEFPSEDETTGTAEWSKWPS